MILYWSTRRHAWAQRASAGALGTAISPLLMQIQWPIEWLNKVGRSISCAPVVTAPLHLNLNIRQIFWSHYIALNMCNGFYFSVENTFFSDKHPTCTQETTGTCILLPRVADKLDCLDLLLFNEGLATGSNPPPTPPHRPPTRLSLCCHQRKRACVCKAINGV